LPFLRDYSEKAVSKIKTTTTKNSTQVLIELYFPE
jgi:hypothetical protein